MRGIRLQRATTAILGAVALLGCGSATLRYVAPAHDEALDTRNVRLTWKITPPEAKLKSCIVEIGSNPDLAEAQKTLLTNGDENSHSMLALGNGNFGYDFDLVGGVYYWRVLCEGPLTGRLVSLDAAEGSAGDDDGARFTRRIRRFVVDSTELITVTQRPVAEAVVAPPRAESRASAFEWPDVVRPSAGTPPPREGSLAVVAARWDGAPNSTFAAELEARLVEAGFYLQQGNDLPEKRGAEESEKGPRPFRLIADSLVFGFEGPPSSPLSRPDRFLLVDVRAVAFDAELFGPELAQKAVRAELSGASPYPRTLRAVYARFVDAKTGRVQWSDRFYVAPSVSMNRVVSELLRR